MSVVQVLKSANTKTQERRNMRKHNQRKRPLHVRMLTGPMIGPFNREWEYIEVILELEECEGIAQSKRWSVECGV